MRDTNLLLRDIAVQIGYNDEFYFSRKFKKEVGVSPSAYGKLSRKQISTFSVAVTGNLVALGIIPVAAPVNAKWSPYYYHFYQEEITTHLTIFDFDSAENYRKLSLAKPDLHIFQEEPSVQMMNWLEQDGIEMICLNEDDWKDQLRALADVVDRQSECENFILTYERKAMQASRDIKQIVKDDLFTVLRLCGNQLYLYSNRGIRDVIHRDLKLHVVEAQRQTCNAPLSIEQLLAINPDHLFIIICPDMTTRNYWLSLQYHEDWKKLNAVKNGHVYILPSNPWFEYSAIAVHRIVDELLLMLTGKNPNPFPVSGHGILPYTEL